MEWNKPIGQFDWTKLTDEDMNYMFDQDPHTSMQIVKAGNVMFDKLTNPQKFRDGQKQMDELLKKRNAIRGAAKIFSEDNGLSKAYGNMHQMKAELQQLNSAKSILQSIGHKTIDEVISIDKKIEELSKKMSRSVDALEFANAVKDIPEIRSSLDDMADGIEAKTWRMNEIMYSGNHNDPESDKFNF